VAISHAISSTVGSAAPLSITPGTVDTIEYVDVVAQNDDWTLTRDADWALSLHLDHEAYGFGEIGDSTLSITLNGVCSTDPCDAVLAVSFGDDSFLPLAVGRDFDNLMPKEIAMKNGDASQFLPASFFDNAILPPTEDKEAAMSVTLEFVNNLEENTLSFKVNGIEHEVSGGAAPTSEDLTLYLLPIGEGQIMQIDNIEVDGQNIGSEDDRAYGLGFLGVAKIINAFTVPARTGGSVAGQQAFNGCVRFYFWDNC